MFCIRNLMLIVWQHIIIKFFNNLRNILKRYIIIIIHNIYKTRAIVNPCGIYSCSIAEFVSILFWQLTHVIPPMFICLFFIEDSIKRPPKLVWFINYYLFYFRRWFTLRSDWRRFRLQQSAVLSPNISLFDFPDVWNYF